MNKTTKNEISRLISDQEEIMEMMLKGGVEAALLAFANNTGDEKPDKDGRENLLDITAHFTLNDLIIYRYFAENDINLRNLVKKHLETL